MNSLGERIDANGLVGDWNPALPVCLPVCENPLTLAVNLAAVNIVIERR